MSYSKKESIGLDTYTVSADKTCDKIDTRELSSGSFGVTWSAAAAVDATVKLQESLDGLTWSDRLIPEAAIVSLNAASGQKKIPIRDLDVPYLRIVVSKNSETTAILSVRYYLKGAR